MNLRKAFKLTSLLIALGAVAFYVSLWVVPLPERLHPPTSQTVEYADGRVAHVFLADDDRWRIETRHDQVDPDYIEALIALEDKRYWSHVGVDPIAVMRATISNASSGRVVSGASTITMQVVRMAEPRPRTMRSKVVESYRAIQLERHYSKEEILDIYLQLLPYGENYEGLETASQVYFGHDASNLGPAEIATLLAVPQAPQARYPSPQNEERLENARNQIAAKLLKEGALPRGMASERLSDEEALEAIEERPVPERIRPMPREIPHLAYRLRGQYPSAERLTTPVERTTQRIAERMVERHRSNIERLGGDHVGVVVMDHRTGELKAAVGNFDYYSDEPGQKMASFDVRRSTGSLLKPFLLARAIDKGVATPSHLVVDAPVDFGGYRPTNYGGTYDGLVRLDEALQRSLNIPFVEMLNRVGVDDFLMTLNRLGAPYPEGPPEAHGLSYAVGGIAASPMEVATLFSAFTRRGQSVPIRRLESGEGVRVFPTTLSAQLSPESVWLVRQVMQKTDRPEFRHRTLLRGGLSPYGWKTGTSMGFRDAWTVGYGPRYVVVAWAGNLDWSPGRQLVGEKAAAPLFFDILEAIDPAQGREYEPPPKGVTSLEVCSFSGHLPTPACEHTEEVKMRRKSVAVEPCPYHVHVDVDIETGEAVTPACRGDRQVEARTFVDLPVAVQRFFDVSGSTVETLPDYARECNMRDRRATIDVTSPPHDTVVTLMRGLPTSDQMIPLDASGAHSGRLNWFVDGRHIGSVRSGERLWWEPEPGRWEFVVTDSHGNAQRRVLEVRQ